MGIPYAEWIKLVERVHPDAAGLHPAAPRQEGKPSSHAERRPSLTTTAKGSYRLVVPGLQPTRLNQLINCHWGTAATQKAVDRRVIAAAVYLSKIPAATGARRVRLTITLGKGQRAADPDAYWKSTLDALVACGMLIDDNRQHVELAPVVFDRAREPATTIELEDL